jgi:hypothetical protein
VIVVRASPKKSKAAASKSKKKLADLRSSPAASHPVVASNPIAAAMTDAHLIAASTELGNILEAKIKCFEFDLYHISTAKHGKIATAPKAFRLAERKMIQVGRVAAPAIDKDGIEVIDDLGSEDENTGGGKQATSFSDISDDESVDSD